MGKSNEIREIMLAFLANGLILPEDIPGVGKTTLALVLVGCNRLWQPKKESMNC